MKKKSMVLAGILIFSMAFSAAAVSAEEAPAEPGTAEEEAGGLMDMLFGENGVISGIIPEDIDVGEAMNTLGEQLKDTGSTFYQTVEGALEMYTNEDGTFDLQKVAETVQGMYGSFSGDEATEEDIEALLSRYDELDDVMKEYLFEYNAQFMDPADVQIYSKQVAYMDDIDLDEIKVLADFCQMNYTIEDDQMILASGASEPHLFTIERAEDGTLAVVDEKHTEDGEGYTASLEALCGEVGITLDDYDASMVFGACNDVDALVEYMEEHPEITGAEYMGEIKTIDELRAISQEYTDGLLAAIFEETDVEEAFAE